MLFSQFHRVWHKLFACIPVSTKHFHSLMYSYHGQTWPQYSRGVAVDGECVFFNYPIASSRSILSALFDCVCVYGYFGECQRSLTVLAILFLEWWCSHIKCVSNQLLFRSFAHLFSFTHLPSTLLKFHLGVPHTSSLCVLHSYEYEIVCHQRRHYHPPK